MIWHYAESSACDKWQTFFRGPHSQHFWAKKSSFSFSLPPVSNFSGSAHLVPQWFLLGLAYCVHSQVRSNVESQPCLLRRKEKKRGDDGKISSIVLFPCFISATSHKNVNPIQKCLFAPQLGLGMQDGIFLRRVERQISSHLESFTRKKSTRNSYNMFSLILFHVWKWNLLGIKYLPRLK